MLREDIKGLVKATSRDLRKFGLTVGGVFLGAEFLFYFRHKHWGPWLVWPGGILFLLGALLPRSLKWIYVAWMTLAITMGVIISTILLTFLFYFVVTPVGLVARLMGKDFLSRKLYPDAASYWLLRDVSQRKSHREHEQQF